MSHSGHVCYQLFIFHANGYPQRALCSGIAISVTSHSHDLARIVAVFLAHLAPSLGW